MKNTYAEQKGYKPFNWNEFLNKTEITEYEWNEAFELAEDWVTCATGNLCDCIPRNESGGPIDNKLRNLGRNFFEAINTKDIELAKNILADIEKRSSKLIKDLELSTK